VLHVDFLVLRILTSNEETSYKIIVRFAVRNSVRQQSLRNRDTWMCRI